MFKEKITQYCTPLPPTYFPPQCGSSKTSEHRPAQLNSRQIISLQTSQTTSLPVAATENLRESTFELQIVTWQIVFSSEKPPGKSLKDGRRIVESYVCTKAR